MSLLCALHLTAINGRNDMDQWTNAHRKMYKKIEENNGRKAENINENLYDLKKIYRFDMN